MKRLSYIILMAMVLMSVAVGCSKSESDDAASLLRTVPADAASVALVNVSHSLERLGCKTDGKTIKLSDDLSKNIGQSQALSAETKAGIKAICDGESGIALNSLVLFAAARSYLTGLLNDPEKFIAFISKNYPGRNVMETDGAKVIGPVAVIGNQFWVCQTGTPDIDQLKYYQNLNDRQSYSSSATSELLLDREKAVNFVADVNRSLSFLPDMLQYARMGSSLIFDNMVYIAGYADIKGESINAEAAFLNSDMKPAEFLLPVEKIDVDVVKSLDGSANIYAAAGISGKLTKKLPDIAGNLLSSGADKFLAPLSAIDGTVALRIGGGGRDAVANIQTNGKDFAAFSSFIQNVGVLLTHGQKIGVTRDGDLLTARTGAEEFSGVVTAASASDKMKGAWFAIVSDGIVSRDVKSVIRLVPDKKSLRLEFEAEGGVDAFLNAILR